MHFIAWRNLCYNLIVIGQGRLTTARVVHTGSVHDMMRELRQGILDTQAAARPFLERWGYLRTRDIKSLLVNPSEDTYTNVLGIMRGLAKQPKTKETKDLPRLRANELPEGVTWAGIERDVLVEELLSAWKHEPGDSPADIVNAVTRLHSQTRVPVPVVRQAEENAGLLAMSWGQA